MEKMLRRQPKIIKFSFFCQYRFLFFSGAQKKVLMIWGGGKSSYSPGLRYNGYTNRSSHATTYTFEGSSCKVI